LERWTVRDKLNEHRAKCKMKMEYCVEDDINKMSRKPTQQL